MEIVKIERGYRLTFHWLDRDCGKAVINYAKVEVIPESTDDRPILLNTFLFISTCVTGI